MDTTDSTEPPTGAEQTEPVGPATDAQVPELTVPVAAVAPETISPERLQKSPLLKNLKKRAPDPAVTQHYAELKARTLKAIGATQIRTALDQTQGRNMWQAWAGSGPFALAEFKGEWGTEIGAIRRLSNRRPAPMPDTVPIAPEPRYQVAGGSGEAVAEVMARRYHQKHAESGWWRWLKRILLTLLVIVGTFGAGALWFADRLASRPTPRPLAPPPVVDREPAAAPPVRETEHPDVVLERRGPGREPSGLHTRSRHEP